MKPLAFLWGLRLRVMVAPTVGADFKFGNFFQKVRVSGSPPPSRSSWTIKERKGD
jgi:hypothetical protein